MSTSTKVTLYKNHLNTIGTWSIWFEENTIHIAHAQVIGGAEVHHTEVVKEGKQSRTLKEQVIHRIKSRINKQLDKGYVKTIAEAQQAPTNALNMFQPMLAHPIKRVKRIDWDNAFVQYKLDGHRCLITNQNGELIAYSRQGKIIDTVDHILADINIPEGVTLDGELYYHGASLQEIASWVKRKQDKTQCLSYHVYDLIDDRPFKDRFITVQAVINHTPNVTFLPTIDVKAIGGHEGITKTFQKARRSNYEGLIVRHGSKGYEAGRRSNSLVKIKETFDGEFKVVDIKPSKDGWAILTCITPEGRTFGVSAPGTVPEKRKVLENASQYIDRLVTVEYSVLTKDEIPFHPVATRWREDI